MEQRVTTTSPNNRVNSLSPQETKDGTSNGLIYSSEIETGQIQSTCSYDNLQNRPGKSGDDTRKGQITGQIKSETTTRKLFCSSSDRYSTGEQLYRELAQLAGLDQQAIQQMIDNSNWETWRKRRQGLTLMCQYIKLRNIKSEQLIAERPDIHVVNAMAWINELGGKSRKFNLISLKTHVSSTLSQFSKMSKISESVLIRNFTRCINLNMESKTRYDVIWNLDNLLNYIEATDFRSPYDDQLHAMSLLVIFSATRMTELSRMQLSDINQEQDKCIIINTQIKKGNRIRNEQIKLNKTNTKLCPVNTLKKQIDMRRSVQQVGDSVFQNFNKSKPVSSTYCSQSFTSLLRNVDIQQPYNGPSIRHASMTKLRTSGASIMVVNAFSLHILTSNVVVEAVYDSLGGTKPRRMVGFVNNPAVNKGLHSPKDQSQCTNAADELATFQEISSSTSESVDNRDSEER
ncbi:MAG: hypothetical protein EZS28_005337 [Streblomastix strix]|uniref:Tyr recombinase domain-containing protein n=1 Tax=Streblomastix strix TaxID=222440 RepID=A0A5J4WW17_9EUKA|nr:MAG: hypothetical protein EZS28_005337 [Streblomastix strix]